MSTIIVVRIEDCYGHGPRIYLFSQLSEAEKRVGQWIWKQVKDQWYGSANGFRESMAQENYRGMIKRWNEMPFFGAPFVSVEEYYLDDGEIR